MNQDIFEGKWKQLKGNAQQWWGDLTDDDLDRVKGHQEELYGVLQERYGWTRERVEREVTDRFDEHDRAQPR